MCILQYFHLMVTVVFNICILFEIFYAQTYTTFKVRTFYIFLWYSKHVKYFQPISMSDCHNTHIQYDNVTKNNNPRSYCQPRENEITEIFYWTSLQNEMSLRLPCRITFIEVGNGESVICFDMTGRSMQIYINMVTWRLCLSFCRMDSVSDSDESYYVALYAVVSFVLVMLIVLLLYVACTKKYRLNWFEKNLLETADAKELAHR